MVEMKNKKILDLLRRNPECSREFLKTVIKENPKILETGTSKIAKKAAKLAKDVRREVHRLKTLTRMDLSPHGILFATIEPRFHVEDLVVRWFWNRFPQFVIVLESKPKRRVFLFGPDFPDLIFTKTNIKDVISDLEQRLPVNPLLEKVAGFTEALWQRYYASQYIPSRKNLKRFFKWLPRKYQKWKGWETEASFGNRHLDEFMLNSQ